MGRSFFWGLLLAIGCGGGDLALPAGGPPTSIAIVSGDRQSGHAREQLAEPIVARVTDAGDRPVEGMAVAFTFDGGSGTALVPDTATTDADGQASTHLRLGTKVGESQGVARVVQSGNPVLQTGFTATTMAADDAAAPTASDDAYTTPEGYEKTLLVPAPGVLANDDDHGSGPLRASNASNPPHGTVSLSPDGGFSYNPDPDYWGEDSFTYRVTNSRGMSSQGTVTITVLSVNDAPVFRIRGGDQVVAANAGPQQVRHFAEVVSPGAPNERGQLLDFIVQVDPQGATLFSQPPAITTDGTLTYVPSGTPGQALVTVRLHDNGGTANGGEDTSTPQTFTITLVSR